MFRTALVENLKVGFTCGSGISKLLERVLTSPLTSWNTTGGQLIQLDVMKVDIWRQ